MLSYSDYASIKRRSKNNKKDQLIIRWYNQNNLKRSINNIFITTHVYVNVYSISNNTKSLKTRRHRVLTDKNENIEHHH